MKKQYPLFSVLVFLAPALFGIAAPCEVATTSVPSAAKISTVPAFIVLRAVTASKPITNGIEVRSDNAVMQVTALRNDVLRVRVGPLGPMPEDASWAVLSAARTANVPVSAEEDSTSVGFRTGALRVRVDRATMRLRVTDLNGTLIQEDAVGRPIEFHGSSFRVYKTMAMDERSEERRVGKEC